MASKICKGGEFDGYKLTTDRDEFLCSNGGGEITQGNSGSSDGCAGETVENLRSPSQGFQPANSLRSVAIIMEATNEIQLLRKLSQYAQPYVVEIFAKNPSFIEKLGAALDRANKIGEQFFQSDLERIVYTAEDHEYFKDIAIEFSRKSGDDKMAELIKKAILIAEPYINSSLKKIREKLNINDVMKDNGPGEDESTVIIPRYDSVINLNSPYSHPLSSILGKFATNIFEDREVPNLSSYFDSLEAKKAIEAKAATLGGLANQPLGKVKSVGDGFVQRYVDCDIYFSKEHGAHEVHGEIRRKYLAINGPLLLGFPTTDESTCPDGFGRYNHFAKNSSIYWTSKTGPFFIRNTRRFRWSSEGWETGMLGYPTTDEKTILPMYPDSRELTWLKFENGIVFGTRDEAANADLCKVTIERNELVDFLGRYIKNKLKDKEISIVGLISVTARPTINSTSFVNVEDWQYDFYAGIPRTLNIRINGEVVVPTFLGNPTACNFTLNLGLQFYKRDIFNYFLAATHTKIIAGLASYTVHTNGIYARTVKGEIIAAINETFVSGNPNPGTLGLELELMEVPNGVNQSANDFNIDFLDIMLMADGSLNLYVNPLPAMTGAVRKIVLNSKVRDFLA